MCYSAQIKADYKRFAREFGAVLSLKDFYDLFWRRLQDPKILVPRAVEAAFETPLTDEERAIQALVAQHAAARAGELQREQDKQRDRLELANLKLLKKSTKTATESKRIAEGKIEALQRRIDALYRTEFEALDLRMFPGSFVPVMVVENGQRVFKPMRYRCRPWHVSASFDEQYPGCYNARRGSLHQFWKHLYGTHHGVVILTSFYEHVPSHLAHGRALEPDEMPSTTQVEFQPDPPQDLLAACIWSRWSAPGEPDLLSFALITDEPPPEVRAGGHDRCVIPIQPEDLDAWLQPSRSDLPTQDAILERHLRPYYGHRLLSSGA